MNAERPALRALARHLGIQDGYRDVDGRERLTLDSTRVALAGAMGHDAGDERLARVALESLEHEARERLLEPVVVWREWAGARPELHLNPGTAGGAHEYRITLRLEDGSVETAEGRVPAQPGPDGLRLPLPLHPPHGHHSAHLALRGPGVEREASQSLVMVPRTVVQPEERLGAGAAFGIWTNLYTVRQEGDWGHGGLRELNRLGSLAGEHGAAFVGINPLHAVTNRGLDFSPYSPSSRLYRNVLYLDPEAVPELGQSDAARALLADPTLQARRAALEARDQIDHEAVLDLCLPILRALHTTFVGKASPERRGAYDVYRSTEGEALRDFATWEVLTDHHREPWWRWPEPLRDPRHPAVEAFRAEHGGEIDFRCWIQFELDRQLAAAAEHLRSAGCGLGIYQDLALGSATASADAWMAPDRFARGAHVGAPPDAYAPEGQDWGFPPLDPHRLRAEGYRPWAQLLRAAFAHTGALRIDHAMGLQRLFWIPEGRPGLEGAYVAYRPDELLGVLALESRRAGAVVVAEDLGTLPAELPGLLADWGLLRSAVVYFECDGDRFRPTTSYPPRALATVTTHDLAPLAGHFEGCDLALRRDADGPDDEQLAKARGERARARAGLVAALRGEGFLGEETDPDAATLRSAVHAFLCATPSVLVGVSLDDLAGESVPVNLPGLSLDEHRSWSRRMALPLDELAAAPEIGKALAPFRARRGPDRS